MNQRRVSFFVDGRPRPKARPRRGKAGWYTPRRTRDYEQLIGWRYREEGGPLFSGPVALCMEFSMPDRRRVDLDNLAKAILDGLNGIAYEDDAQVYHIDAIRRVDGQCPGVQVTVLGC